MSEKWVLKNGCSLLDSGLLPECCLLRRDRTKMKPLRVAAIMLCCAIAACGGAVKHVATASHQSSTVMGRTTTTVTGGLASPIVAHVSGRLMGDEDDDDSPSNHTANTNNDSDADFDNDYKHENMGYFDSDDDAARNFGHAARPSDKRAITALVERYYAAAAAANGATACALTYWILAGSIAEDYGQPPGPAYLHGNTCAIVMTKLFQHDHARLATSMEIVAIRLRGAQANVLLGSATLPASFLSLRRERGVWKVYNLYPAQLP
jgi:hypothetical protein